MSKYVIDRLKVYEKCHGHCGYCGLAILMKNMQIDHIIPQIFFLYNFKNKNRIPEFLKHLTETDVHHFDNLMPACRVCNKWKSAHSLEQFRIEIQEQIERLNTRSANYRMVKKFGMIQEFPKPVIFYFENKND